MADILSQEEIDRLLDATDLPSESIKEDVLKKVITYLETPIAFDGQIENLVVVYDLEVIKKVLRLLKNKVHTKE